MVRQPWVRLLVALELLALAAWEGEKDGLGAVAKEVFALQHAEILASSEESFFGGVDVTLAEREVIDGVEQIGLAHTIIAEEAVDLRRANDVSLPDVLIVQDGELVQYHTNK